MPLNVDDLSTEELRAIAAAAMKYCWLRDAATVPLECAHARQDMLVTYRKIKEAHNAAKKD